MTGKNIITSIITISVALTFYSVNVRADDCSISINTKASVKCLQRKVISLEKRLAKTKKNQLVLPKGALIDFTTKDCPVGWREYKAVKNDIISINTVNNVIKCQKA